MSEGTSVITRHSRLVLTPESRKRVNRPIPQTNALGVQLPPLNIDLIYPSFLVRQITDQAELTALFGGGSVLEFDIMKIKAQPVAQILALPERVEVKDPNGGESKWIIPGWPESKQSAQVGDIFLSMGRAATVLTNWGPANEVLLASDPSIIACFLYEGHYHYE